MRPFKLIFTFLLFLAPLIVGVVFLGSNTDKIQLKFWVYTSPPMEIWLVVFLAFFIGALFAIIFCAYELMRLSLKAKGYKKQLRKLEGKLPSVPLNSQDSGEESGSEANDLTIN